MSTRRPLVRYGTVDGSTDIDFPCGSNDNKEDSQNIPVDLPDRGGPPDKDDPSTPDIHQNSVKPEDPTSPHERITFAKDVLMQTLKEKDRKIIKEFVRNKEEKRLESSILIKRESIKKASMKELIDTVQDQDIPLLHYAVQCNAWDCLRVLCETGRADINVKDSQGRSALHHIAVKVYMNKTSEKGAKYLIGKGACVDATTTRNCTPLHYAAESGNMQMIQILFASGVNKAFRDAFENNVLHRAVRGGYFDMVTFLLEDDQVKPCLYQANAEGHTPLHYAVWYNAKDMVTTMLRTMPDSFRRQEVNKVDKGGNTAIMLAVKKQADVDIIQVLLTSGADIDIKAPDGTTVLHLAAAGVKRYCKLLIEHAINQSTYVDFLERHFRENSTTPLHVAARTDNVDAIRLMAPSGEPEYRPIVLNCVDEKGDVPFLTAVRNGAEEAAIALLELGTDVLVTSKSGQAALHMALQNKQTGLIQMFLLCRRDEDFMPSIGIVYRDSIFTPVDRVDTNQRADDLKKNYLRSMLNIQDRNGYTPLHYTVLNADQQYTEMLLDLGLYAGIQLRLKSKAGLSPVLFAVERGHFGIFKVLFEAMGKRRVTLQQAAKHDADDHNNTAAHLAAARDHLDILQYLHTNDEGLLLNRNNENQTPLQMAVAHGSLNTVRYLVEINSPETLEIGNVSMCEAVSEGHTKTIKYLLETLPEEKIPVSQLMDLAVGNENRKMVQVILNSKYWKESLAGTNTFSRMIQNIPSEARQAMDKCIEMKNDLTVDFTIFKRAKGGGGLRTRAMKWFDTSNHPVKLIIDSADEDLLCHPAFLSYVRELWKSARFIYWLCLLSLFIFALVVSVNVTIRMKAATIKSKIPAKIPANSSVAKLIKNQTETHPCNWMDPTEHSIVMISSIFIIVATCVGFLIEVLQLLVSGRVYFRSIDNWFDLAMYALCFPVALDLQGCYKPADWQWDLGPFAVLVSWFHLLFFMKGVPLCGLHICMASDILTSFLSFLTVFILFILAFAISFSILLHDLPPFQNVLYAFPTMWVMATGELGYTDLFHADELGDESPLGHQAVAAFCLLLIFVSVMTIIIANLMIGLAVEDVSRLRQKAKVHMVKVRAELFLEMNYLHLPIILVNKIRQSCGYRRSVCTSVTYPVADRFRPQNQQQCIKILHWKDDFIHRDYIIKRALNVVQGKEDKVGTIEELSKAVQRNVSQIQTLMDIMEEIRDRLPLKARGSDPETC